MIKNKPKFFLIQFIYSQCLTFVCYLIMMFINFEIIIPYKFILDVPHWNNIQRLVLLIIIPIYYISTYFGTNSNSTTPTSITSIPSSNGTNGTRAYKLISTASTNENIVKSSAGNLYSIVAIGLTSTVRYLKFFNTASAISWGEDIPVMTIPIPANTQGAGVVIPFYFGVDFRVGIAIGITAGSADNNEDPIDAGDVIVNLTYA